MSACVLEQKLTSHTSSFENNFSHVDVRFLHAYECDVRFLHAYECDQSVCVIRESVCVKY